MQQPASDVAYSLGVRQEELRRQLDKIRERVNLQRFSTDLAARAARGSVYHDAAATQEHMESQRPAPLPSWRAFMSVDASLTEREARDLASHN